MTTSRYGSRRRRSSGSVVITFAVVPGAKDPVGPRSFVCGEVTAGLSQSFNEHRSPTSDIVQRDTLTACCTKPETQDKGDRGEAKRRRASTKSEHAARYGHDG
ncbi:MAG: hypothetical protein M3460_07355 [Actinomycetota bacterium]|nr:hypothetical protein [Actinomycetota bacterium]